MTDQTPNPTPTEVTPTPAGAQNTDTAGNPSTVPYDRFKQVNDEKKAALDKLAELEKAQAQREKEALEKRGEFEALYNGLKPKAERADALEAVVKLMLEDEIKLIPDHMRALVPAGDVVSQLNWVRQAKAAGLFTRTPAPNLDAGVTGNAGTAVRLTPEQQKIARQAGMTDEQYMKAFLKSQGA